LGSDLAIQAGPGQDVEGRKVRRCKKELGGAPCEKRKNPGGWGGRRCSENSGGEMLQLARIKFYVNLSIWGKKKKSKKKKKKKKKQSTGGKGRYLPLSCGGKSSEGRKNEHPSLGEKKEKEMNGSYVFRRKSVRSLALSAHGTSQEAFGWEGLSFPFLHSRQGNNKPKPPTTKKPKKKKQKKMRLATHSRVGTN